MLLYKWQQEEKGREKLSYGELEFKGFLGSSAYSVKSIEMQIIITLSSVIELMRIWS